MSEMKQMLTEHLFFFFFVCCCIHTAERQNVSTKSSLAGSDLQVGKAGDNTEQLRKTDELHEKEETIRQLTEELNNLRSRQGAVFEQQNQPLIDVGLSKSSLDAPKPSNHFPGHSLKTSQFPHHDNPKPAASMNRNRPKSLYLSQDNNSKFGVLRQIGNAASGHLIQKRSHNHSCPALSTDNAALLSSFSSASTFEEKKDLVRSMSLSLSLPRSHSARSQRRDSTSSVYKTLPNVPEEM